MKYWIGTCINSFDNDGDCVDPSLPYRDVSDFAVAEEDAEEITLEEFLSQASIPDSILNATANHDCTYLVDMYGVLMLYDEDGDIHYFFV